MGLSWFYSKPIGVQSHCSTGLGATGPEQTSGACKDPHNSGMGATWRPRHTPSISKQDSFMNRRNNKNNDTNSKICTSRMDLRALHSMGCGLRNYSEASQLEHVPTGHSSAAFEPRTSDARRGPCIFPVMCCARPDERSDCI